MSGRIGRILKDYPELLGAKDLNDYQAKVAKLEQLIERENGAMKKPIRERMAAFIPQEPALAPAPAAQADTDGLMGRILAKVGLAKPTPASAERMPDGWKATPIRGADGRAVEYRIDPVYKDAAL